VRVIVPQGPGGPTDLLARVAAQRLQAVLHQNFIIENRGGAGGVIAAKAAASAEADGYTLFMGNTSVLVLIPILSKTANYDPAKLFTPVARLAESYQVLVVHPSLPVKTVAELVAYAKANPNKLNYSSAGIGNTIPLAGELFNHEAGTRIVHVPYNSGAEATRAVLGGQVQMTFVNITGLPPLIADGKLRALAVTGPKRMALLPDVPTMVESGFPDFVVRAFFGLAAPSGTPAPIVDKLNATINAEMSSNEVQTTLKRLGAEPGSGTAAEFAAFIAAERKRWSAVAKAANISID
jgi:tripartite-type tricarboxylate transporter receptor subunit TctC